MISKVLIFRLACVRLRLSLLQIHRFGVQSWDMSSPAAGQIAVVVVAVSWMLGPFIFYFYHTIHVQIYTKGLPEPESVAMCVVMQTVAGQNKLWLLLAVVIKGQHLCKLSMA